jgi:hypothetical protein
MNINFYTAHLETLCELKKIAEKHNYEIRLGFRHDFSNHLDTETLLNRGIDKKVIEILEKPFNYNISILDIKSSNDSFWFELYDKEKDKSHTMSYCECDCGFKIETDFDYEENELLENFIDEHRSEYCDCGENLFRFENAPTIIYGFGYDGRHIDGRCYREGMALKFFGDLVCDYLNEPRIERVY